jgi:hypothetical protein
MQPTKFELDRQKTLGITAPRTLLVGAFEVIEQTSQCRLLAHRVIWLPAAIRSLSE